MKATLEFNLPEEQVEHEHALKGEEYMLALRDIADQVFRPARKHGYSDEELNKLVSETNGGAEIVAKLEEKFYEILNNFDVNLWK